MKKFSIFLFLAAALSGIGCEESSDTDKEVVVLSVVLDPSLADGLFLAVGDTGNIAGKVTVYPEEAAGLPETYESSDPTIVSVELDGDVEALKPGLAMITVSVGGKHAHFTVTVEPKKVPVESVTLPEEWRDGVSLKIGETLRISDRFVIAPDNATQTDATYESSNPEIAVIEEGVVKTLAIGETQITITVDGKSAAFTLTVEKIAVESVTLPDEWKEGAEILSGGSLELAGKVTILPENATFKTESYRSSEETVATIDDQGVVTAHQAGTTEITITVDEQSATFTLTVQAEKIAVESVTLPDEWIDGAEILLGSTLELAGRVTILPEDATLKTESYRSSEEAVATIDDQGVVTTHKAGTTEITITVDEQSATFTLTVVEPPVALEKIEIKEGASAIEGSVSVVLGPDATFDLSERLTLSPANQNEGVKYVAYGPEEVATIDENGIVTCKGVGTVTFVILAKSNTTNDFKNAGEKKAYFAVNVTDPQDCDRTGWQVSSRSHNLPTGSQNSDTALFDDTFDPNVFKTVHGSNYVMVRPGKTSGGVDARDDAEIWFVVDMQQTRAVNYFRIMHQSCRNTDRGCRWIKFAEILGSTDGVDFTSIATNVAIPNLEYAMGVDPNDGGSRNLDTYRTCSNVVFSTETVNYRYLKFVGTRDSFSGTTSTGQIAELYLGLDE